MHNINYITNFATKFKNVNSHMFNKNYTNMKTRTEKAKEIKDLIRKCINYDIEENILDIWQFLQLLQIKQEIILKYNL